MFQFGVPLPSSFSLGRLRPSSISDILLSVPLPYPPHFCPAYPAFGVFYSLFGWMGLQQDMWGGFKNSKSTRGRENGKGGKTDGGGWKEASVLGSTLTNGSAELARAPGSADS